MSSIAETQKRNMPLEGGLPHLQLNLLKTNSVTRVVFDKTFHAVRATTHGVPIELNYYMAEAKVEGTSNVFVDIWQITSIDPQTRRDALITLTQITRLRDGVLTPIPSSSELARHCRAMGLEALVTAILKKP